MKGSGQVVLILMSMVAIEAFSAQPVENALVDSNGLVTESESFTRCGKYFVIERKEFGEFVVNQVHVAFEIPSGIATEILYARDLAVVLDESKSVPVVLHKRENPDLEKDTIRLSTVAYEEAKECLPEPQE